MSNRSVVERPTAAFRVLQAALFASLGLQAALFIVPGIGGAIAQLAADPADDAAAQAGWALPAWAVVANCVVGAVLTIAVAALARPSQRDIFAGLLALPLLGYGLMSFAIAGRDQDPSGLLYSWGAEPIHLGWHWLGVPATLVAAVFTAVRLVQLTLRNARSRTDDPA